MGDSATPPVLAAPAPDPPPTTDGGKPGVAIPTSAARPGRKRPPLEPRRLSEVLGDVLKAANDRPMSIGDILKVLGDRGHAVAVLLLATPFLLPIVPPGFSTVVGAFIAVVGFFITVGMKPRLPGFILRREVPFSILQHVVGFLQRVSKRLEKVVVPRLTFMLWPGPVALAGASMTMAALILAAPLPIPGTNAPPALPIVLIALGLIERDGLLLLLGEILVLGVLGFVTWAAIAHGDDVWMRVMGVVHWLGTLVGT